jgi:hypothetical protein
MAEDTTTDSAAVDSGDIQASEPQIINGIAVDDQGQALVAPDETDSSEAAVETTTDEPQTEVADVTTGADTALPEVDDKLQKYASSNGIELDSPGAIKAAQIGLKAQSEATRNYQKASELEKSMTQMGDVSAEQVAEATGENPEVLKRLQRVEIRDSIRNFWESNPEARQYESQMSEIAQSAGLYGTPEAILKASYAIAKSQDGDNLKTQGGREALEKLAAKQQAAVPRGNAVSSAPTSEPSITPQNVDQLVGSHDLKWFEANRDAINRAMTG